MEYVFFRYIIVLLFKYALHLEFISVYREDAAFFYFLK